MSSVSNKENVENSVRCPRCGMGPGARCNPGKREKFVRHYGVHAARVDAWWESLGPEGRRVEFEDAAASFARVLAAVEADKEAGS